MIFGVKNGIQLDAYGPATTPGMITYDPNAGRFSVHDAYGPSSVAADTLQIVYNNGEPHLPDIQLATSDTLDFALGSGLGSTFNVYSSDGYATLTVGNDYVKMFHGGSSNETVLVTDGYVRIDGYLTVTGQTIQINTAVTDSDHLLVQPGLSNTVAVEIMPAISNSLYTADLLQIYDGYNGNLVFKVDHSGRVGIGTSPTQTLDVAGNARFGTNHWLTLFDAAAGNGSLIITNIGSIDFGAYFLFRNGNGSTEYMRVDSTGFLGIGSSAPASLLSVGATNQFQVNSSGNIVKVNSITYSWPSSQGASSTTLTNDGYGNLSWVVAASSLPGRTNGTNNIFVGTGAGNAGLTSSGVSALGVNAGSSLTSGSNNVIIGYNTGTALTTGGSNIFIGPSAGNATVSTSQNIFIGQSAGVISNTGTNTFIGYQSGFNNTTGNRNTAVGNLAMQGGATGTDNTYIGDSAGASAGAATSSNTSVGSNSGNNNTGSDCAFFGRSAGAINAGNDNTFLGRAAGQNNGAGTQNTFVGRTSGNANTTGSNNTLIGYNTQTGNFSNSIAIGNNAATTASSQMMIGATGSDSVTVTLAASTSGTFGFKPAATTTSYTVTMPAAQGAASTFLQNDGAGNLSWAAGGGGGSSTNVSTTFVSSGDSSTIATVTIYYRVNNGQVSVLVPTISGTLTTGHIQTAAGVIPVGYRPTLGFIGLPAFVRDNGSISTTNMGMFQFRNDGSIHIFPSPIGGSFTPGTQVGTNTNYTAYAYTID